ncbi:MAG: peptidylprolyl isomerase [Candidatus Moraniibacteriota bacterium]
MVEVDLPIKPFKPQWPKIVFAVFFLIAILAVGVLVVVYKMPDSVFGRLFTTRFPFPLVLVGQGVAVTTQGLAENREALRHFYESQDFAELGMRVDFSTEDGKKRLKIRERDLINKMLEDRALELLARNRNIVVTNEQIEAETTVKMKELGTTDKVEETLARLYGWTLADFQKQIVRPAMYEEALLKAYEAEVNQSVAEEKIAAAQQELKAKKPFADVARSHSQGETRMDGGDLGWFQLEELAPELRSPVDTAKLNVPTGTIESPLGYHILLVEDTKLENEKRLYHIRQIFMRKQSFADWLSAQMGELPVSIISDEYEWWREEARIEFRSEEMRAFEKKLRESAESDPTLLF